VRIPVLPKFVTILLDFAHKQELENPNMFRVLPIKLVVPFKSRKEATPQSGEVSTHFYPKSLNMGV
jgi:hypothetical protein